MQLRRAVFAAFVGFVVYIVLQLVSLFDFIGTEYNILVQWVSIISLVLTGVLVGMLVSEEKIPVKTAFVNLLLVLFGLALIPIVTGVSATILNTTNLATETKMVVTFILSVSCGVIYMIVFILYRRRQDSTCLTVLT